MSIQTVRASVRCRVGQPAHVAERRVRRSMSKPSCVSLTDASALIPRACGIGQQRRGSRAAVASPSSMPVSVSPSRVKSTAVPCLPNLAAASSASVGRLAGHELAHRAPGEPQPRQVAAHPLVARHPSSSRLTERRPIPSSPAANVSAWISDLQGARALVTGGIGRTGRGGGPGTRGGRRTGRHCGALRSTD